MARISGGRIVTMSLRFPGNEGKIVFSKIPAEYDSSSPLTYSEKEYKEWEIWSVNTVWLAVTESSHGVFFKQIVDIYLFSDLFAGTCWACRLYQQLYSFLASCFFPKVPAGSFRRARPRGHGGSWLKCVATRQLMKSTTASKTTLKRKKKRLEQVCWILVGHCVCQWGDKNQKECWSCSLWELDAFIYLYQFCSLKYLRYW